MTDNKSRLTFSDLASRPRTPVQTSSHLWDKASKIMGAHPKCLKSELFNGTWYKVSPSQTFSHRGRSITYAIARPEELGAGSDMLFVVIDNDFGKLVQINRYGEAPLTVYRLDDVHAPLEEVDPSGFDAVLGSLLANVQKIADADKNRFKRAARERLEAGRQKWRRVSDEAKGLTLLGTVAVVAFGGLFYGIASIDSTGDVAERFDQQYPGLVIDGTEVHLGESKTLGAHAPDMEKGLSWSPTGDIQLQPRKFTVDADSCRTGDSVEEFGYLNGNQSLIAAAEAPEGTIRVDVARDGLVTVCANDLEGRGSAGQDVIVLLQAVNN